MSHSTRRRPCGAIRPPPWTRRPGAASVHPSPPGFPKRPRSPCHGRGARPLLFPPWRSSGRGSPGAAVRAHPIGSGPPGVSFLVCNETGQRPSSDNPRGPVANLGIALVRRLFPSPPLPWSFPDVRICPQTRPNRSGRPFYRRNGRSSILDDPGQSWRYAGRIPPPRFRPSSGSTRRPPVPWRSRPGWRIGPPTSNRKRLSHTLRADSRQAWEPPL